MSTRRSLAPTTLVTALVTAVLLGGCGGGAQPIDVAAPETAGPSSGATAPLRYVALGDSFTAAPLVPRIDGGSGSCLRSTGNYPALLAEALGDAGRPVRLTDRSCVAATTADLFAPQQLDDRTVPPQSRALDRRTDLVTIGIGGNDVLASLTGLTDDAAPGLTALRDDLAGALRRVVRLAPRARVVVVGYPQTVPPATGCADLGLPAAELGPARAVADGLDDALRGAAADAGVEFADSYTASAGRHICGRRPWINGATTDLDAALAYHPLARGQQGVATLLAAGLRA